MSGYYLHDTGVIDGVDDCTNCKSRPVVVIDPEDLEQVSALGSRLYRQGLIDGDMTYDDGVDRVQAALRSLLAPEKPAEPQGLGAVVEDADGHRWVVDVNGRWWCAHREPNTTRRHFGDWADVPAVKVLSEGVTP